MSAISMPGCDIYLEFGSSAERCVLTLAERKLMHYIGIFIFVHGVDLGFIASIPLKRHITAR